MRGASPENATRHYCLPFGSGQWIRTPRLTYLTRFSAKPSEIRDRARRRGIVRPPFGRTMPRQGQVRGSSIGSGQTRWCSMRQDERDPEQLHVILHHCARLDAAHEKFGRDYRVFEEGSVYQDSCALRIKLRTLHHPNRRRGESPLGRLHSGASRNRLAPHLRHGLPPGPWLRDARC